MIYKTEKHITGSFFINNSALQGHVPFLSLEALHQLHIFIFVLAVVYVIFCASTMVLGGIKVCFSVSNLYFLHKSCKYFLINTLSSFLDKGMEKMGAFN